MTDKKLEKKVKIKAIYPIGEEKATLWGVGFILDEKEKCYTAEVDEVLAKEMVKFKRAEIVK